MEQPSLSLSHHTGFDWRSRLRAALVRLALSVAVAAAVAVPVLLVWFPHPLGDISGGYDLFLMVLGVDVVLGPVLIFAVYDRTKPPAALRRDLIVVALIQLAGLAYGLWTVHQARPVHVVFEYDRFRVVHRAEIPEESESLVPAGLELAPFGRPTFLALRPFRNADEQGEYTMMALSGIPLSARPELWQSYEVGRPEVLRAARPAAQLKQRFPQQAAEIDAVLRASGRDASQAVYLPLMARKPDVWTTLLDAKTAEPIASLPLDSF